MTTSPCPIQRIRLEGDEDADDSQGSREGTDRDEDVQPKLGPAVGVLVEPEPDRGGDEDDPGQAQQREHPDQIRAAPPDDTGLEGDDDCPGEASRGDELEEATPGVVAIGQPGGDQRVEPAEQVGDLEPDEEPDDQVDDREHDQCLGGADDPGRDCGTGPCGRAERRPLDLRDPDRRDRQQSGRQPGARECEQEPPRQSPEIDLHAEQVLDASPEDRVRRGEQEDEDQGDRECQHDAANDRQHLLGDPLRSIEQRPSVGPGGTCGADDRRLERPGAERSDGRCGPPSHRQPRQRHDRPGEEDHRTDGIECRDERIAANSHECGQDEGRRRQPRVEWVGRPARSPQEPAGDQARDHDHEDVDAVGGSVEDELGEHADDQAGGKDAAGDGSVQWAVLHSGRRGQARAGGSGSGRPGNLPRDVGARTPHPCVTQSARSLTHLRVRSIACSRAPSSATS